MNVSYLVEISHGFDKAEKPSLEEAKKYAESCEPDYIWTWTTTGLDNVVGRSKHVTARIKIIMQSTSKETRKHLYEDGNFSEKELESMLGKDYYWKGEYVPSQTVFEDGFSVRLYKHWRLAYPPHSIEYMLHELLERNCP